MADTMTGGGGMAAIWAIAIILLLGRNNSLLGGGSDTATGFVELYKAGVENTRTLQAQQYASDNRQIGEWYNTNQNINSTRDLINENRMRDLEKECCEKNAKIAQLENVVYTDRKFNDIERQNDAILCKLSGLNLVPQYLCTQSATTTSCDGSK